MVDEVELSEREIEIVKLVATGASNKEIAKTLVISPNTVKVHLRNIFSKLGVLSRTEATMTAIRMGWVEAPGTQAQKLDDEESLQQLNESLSQNLRLAEQTEHLKKRNKIIGFVAFSLILVLVGFIVTRELFFQSNSPPAIDPAVIEQLSSDRWTAIENLPVGLSNMGFVRFENKFYLFGGEDPSGVKDEVWIYSIDGNQWTLGEKLPEKLKNFQAINLGEKIYIPGGIGEENQYANSLWIFDPRSNAWKKGKEIPMEIGAYSSVAYEGKIYLFGGYDGENYLDSILMFDPEVNEWERYGTMPTAVAFSSAVVLGGQIHIFGGMNNSGVLDNHYVYYPLRENSSEQTWDQSEKLPEPRSGMNSIVLADMVYLAGGENEVEEILPPIQYLPQKDSWVAIDLPPVDIGHGPAVLPYETRLYVIGGLNSEGYSNQALVYQAVYTILVPVVR